MEAVLVGVVVGTAVHAALNAGIARLLIHTKNLLKFKGVKWFRTKLRALTVWTVFSPVIPNPRQLLFDFLPTAPWE